jgi:hypothetical protein
MRPASRVGGVGPSRTGCAPRVGETMSEKMTPEQLVAELARNNAASKKASSHLNRLMRERKDLLRSLRPSIPDGGTVQVLLEPGAKVPTLLEISRDGDEMWCQFKPLRGPDAIEWRPDIPEIQVMDDRDEVVLAERDVALATAARGFEPHPEGDIHPEVA